MVGRCIDSSPPPPVRLPLFSPSFVLVGFDCAVRGVRLRRLRRLRRCPFVLTCVGGSPPSPCAKDLVPYLKVLAVVRCDYVVLLVERGRGPGGRDSSTCGRLILQKLPKNASVGTNRAPPRIIQAAAIYTRPWYIWRRNLKRANTWRRRRGNGPGTFCALWERTRRTSRRRRCASLGTLRRQMLRRTGRGSRRPPPLQSP